MYSLRMSFEILLKVVTQIDKIGHKTKFNKGAFKYYVIKEVGGWGQKIAIFDDLQYCRSSKR